MLTFDDCLAFSDADARTGELHALDTITALQAMAGGQPPAGLAAVPAGHRVDPLNERQDLELA